MSTTLPLSACFCFVEVFYCSVVIVLFFFWSVAIVLALTVFVYYFAVHGSMHHSLLESLATYWSTLQKSAL